VESPYGPWRVTISPPTRSSTSAGTNQHAMLDEPVRLERAQVVVDLLARQPDPRGQRRRRGGLGQLAQQPRAHGIERDDGGGRLPPVRMPSMEHRRLGDSDLEVSVIALGSWLTYGVGVERDQTEACTRAAFDAGITFFDTANVYGRGAAESAWGEILAGYPRDSFVLATKVYFPMSARDRGLSRGQIHKQIDASLERLRVDHVDLYQCHRYDDDVPLEETMEALTEVVRAGKARWIGFSEWPPDRIQAALDLPGVAKFVSSQPQYSALWRGPEAEVIPLCERNGISQIVWSPLAQGVLTGKYRPGEVPPPDSRARSSKMNRFIKQWLTDDILAAVDRLHPVADQAGLTLSRLALAWVLRQPNVAAAIVGASRPEQVHENVAAAGVQLSDDTLRAIDDALAPVAIR
jgi:aryl-alcohol dehydrogenase-like predicted oxidoreductase